MAIAFRTIVGNTTPAHPIAIDPSATSGDTIINGVITDSATGVTFTYPTSFTELVNALCNSSDGGSLGVAYKKTASGSEGSISTSNSGSQQMIGFMLSFSGVDQTTPIDVTPPAAVTNTTQTAAPLVIDSNSITPVTNGSMIVAVRLTDVSAGESKPCTFSTLSGSTGSWTTNDYNNAGGFYNISVGYASQTTAGALTVRSSTSGAANAAGSLFVFALRPAGAAAAKKLRSQLFLQGVGA